MLTMQMINLMEECFDKFYLSKYNIRNEMWPLPLSKYSATFGSPLLTCIFIHEGQGTACFLESNVPPSVCEENLLYL